MLQEERWRAKERGESVEDGGMSCHQNVRKRFKYLTRGMPILIMS